MDGGSTIGVPNTATALADVPHGSRAEAQAASKGRGGVAARGRPRLVLKGALINRARVGARDALSARAGLEGGALVGRARQADGGEGQATALGVDGSRGDGAWVRLGLAGSRALAEDVAEGLAGDRGTPAVSGTRARERRGVAVGGHDGQGGASECERVCGVCCVLCAGWGEVVN